VAPSARPHGCPQSRRAVPLTPERRKRAPRASFAAVPAAAASFPSSSSPPPPRALSPAAAAITTTTSPPSPPSPQEAVDILFAGYSDVAERLRQLENKGLAAVERGGRVATPSNTTTTTPWDAAVYLLFFLAFINVAGWIALWQAQAAIGASSAVPWWHGLGLGGSPAAMAAASSRAPFFAVALKRIVLLFVPLTNTVVVLTFCAAAVRAALALLMRGWE
jgi:hypothetical protein